MITTLKRVSGALAIAMSTGTYADILPDNQKQSPWFQEAEARINQQTQRTQTDHARNVILFIGDGMGVSTLTAARILEGQTRGKSGEEGYLSFETFPYSAMVKTYNVDAQTPDSAGTMTAMISGIKTNMGVIGVDEQVKRGDCSSLFGHEVVTALELAELKGLSTGIVSTARITHATPAATYAKSVERNWEGNADMPAAAIEAGCEDIASQLIHFESNLEQRFKGADVDGMEVAFGGGRRYFLPNDASHNSEDSMSPVEGKRTDGRNLVAEWQAEYNNGIYVMQQTDFDALDTETTQRVLGLFNPSHMHYEADRRNDRAGEPSLTEMTQKAIHILDNNEKGYFLMVEAGRIDHGHHAGNAYSALTETIELSKAVQAARETTNADDTLIIVVADHSHVFTIAGYPKRGNPILGKVVGVGQTVPNLAKDGMPYTTLGYTNGRGFMNLGAVTDGDASYDQPINAGRKNLTHVDTESSGFHQEALIPLSSETHSGEDIAIHAIGPGAYRMQGTVEQNTVFHLINQSLNLVAE